MYSYPKLVIGLLLLMCTARGALGLFSYLDPPSVFDAYGLPHDNSILLYFVRLWAGRDVVIALLVATAGRAYLKPLLVACLAIETLDVTAAWLGVQEGYFTMSQFVHQFWTVMIAFIPEAIALALILRHDRLSARPSAA